MTGVCKELFRDSERDSTYEQIGQDGTFGDLGDLDLGDLDLGDVDLDDLDASGTLQELGLQLMWDSLDPDDQEPSASVGTRPRT